MRFHRLRRWRAFLFCRFENHADDHVYTSYDETFGNESISSKDTNSHSSSSDGGISLADQSWTSNETNVYDQICYDSIPMTTNNHLSSKYIYGSPPYVPNDSSDDSTEHYYYRLPTPTCLIPCKTSISSEQNNSKKELHRELIHRQKMGQLLPKKPELINVFQHRRVEEKKRESERTREPTKLEEILARQRQKLDEMNNVCSISSNKSAYSNEFEFVYHRIRQKRKE